MTRHKGIFITFEGPEGSGKSTLIKVAAKFFRQKGFPVLMLREPGGTTLGEKIRELLLHEKGTISEECELLLYLAARAEIVREKILPGLHDGAVVICDRFHDSTRAYQGYGSGISLGLIEEAGDFAKAGIDPDLTFLLDTDVKRGLKRAGRGDRVERKSLAFHKRVRRGFLELAKKYPERILVIPEEDDMRVKIGKFRKLLDGYMKKRIRKAL